MPKNFNPRDFVLASLKDPEDDRDFLASAILPEVALPPSSTYRPLMTPVENQSSAPKCVSFATTAVSEYFNSLEYNKTLDFSEQWIYDQCKLIDGYPGDGTYPRTACDILKTYGVPEEIYQPYELVTPATRAPLPGLIANAAKYKITAYAAVRTLDSFKQAIYLSGPCIISMMVYDSFYNITYNGIIPSVGGNLIGGHAMCCCGYDDNFVTPYGLGVLIIKNSWSDRFGDRGYLYLPYQVFESLVMDGWTMIDASMLDSITIWPDWRKDSATGLFIEELAGKLVKSKNVFNGYPDGTFRPDSGLLQRQVKIVMGRLDAIKNGVQLPSQYTESKIDGYDVATRAWTRDTFIALQWDSQRWEEPLTRFQFVLLIARYIATIGI